MKGKDKMRYILTFFMSITDQKKMNVIWELTQAAIALTIAVSVVYCAINNIDDAEIKNAFFLIVGFYFARGNQQNTNNNHPSVTPPPL